VTRRSRTLPLEGLKVDAATRFAAVELLRLLETPGPIALADRPLITDGSAST
jgi:hypothetical protein